MMTLGLQTAGAIKEVKTSMDNVEVLVDVRNMSRDKDKARTATKALIEMELEKAIKAIRILENLLKRDDM